MNPIKCSSKMFLRQKNNVLENGCGFWYRKDHVEERDDGTNETTKTKKKKIGKKTNHQLFDSRMVLWPVIISSWNECAVPNAFVWCLFINSNGIPRWLSDYVTFFMEFLCARNGLDLSRCFVQFRGFLKRVKVNFETTDLKSEEGVRHLDWMTHRWFPLNVQFRWASTCHQRSISSNAS